MRQMFCIALRRGLLSSRDPLRLSRPLFLSISYHFFYLLSFFLGRAKQMSAFSRDAENGLARFFARPTVGNSTGGTRRRHVATANQRPEAIIRTNNLRECWSMRSR